MGEFLLVVVGGIFWFVGVFFLGLPGFIGLFAPSKVGLSSRKGALGFLIAGVMVAGLGEWIIPNGGDDEATVSRSAVDVECRQDLDCWGSRHRTDALVLCTRMVERSAQYAHEWTDGFLGSKLDGYAWANRSRGTVMYYGDQVRYQNAYGATQQMFYKCTYDPATESLVNFEVLPRA